jgi:hypothetical protein
MSVGLKRVWEAGDNWRVLGYLYYRNSLEYRQLIALNPSFDIRTIPAPGVQINASGQMATGDVEPDLMAPGGQLMGVDQVINLSNNSNASGGYPTTSQATIFPWTNFGTYVNRLGQYTAAGLLDKQRINGMMLDSPQARFTPMGEIDTAQAKRTAAINRAVLGEPADAGLTFEAVANSSQTAALGSAGTGVSATNAGTTY